MRILLCCFTVFLLSCSDEEPKAIITALEEVERGAVLRTEDYSSNDFIINDLDSRLKVLIEEDDILEGDLLDRVDVYLQYKGNTPSTAGQSTSEVLYTSLEAAVFTPGPFGRPSYTIDITFGEALVTMGLTLEDVKVKDQFLLRLDLKLTDGRTFNESNASSIIIAYDTFFSSPFCYTVNVVQPIDESSFIGMYRLESILDGPSGEETFVDSEFVEVTKGRSNTTRQFYALHYLHHRGLEAPRRWEFNIVGDETVFGKNQLSSPEGWCIRNSAPMLLGPDTVNGSADPIDDTVFELWFVEGYLGFDGKCGFGTGPSRYRFTKQ